MLREREREVPIKQQQRTVSIIIKVKHCKGVHLKCTQYITRCDTQAWFSLSLPFEYFLAVRKFIHCSSNISKCASHSLRSDSSRLLSLLKFSHAARAVFYTLRNTRGWTNSATSVLAPNYLISKQNKWNIITSLLKYIYKCL